MAGISWCCEKAPLVLEEKTLEELAREESLVHRTPALHCEDEKASVRSRRYARRQQEVDAL